MEAQDLYKSLRESAIGLGVDLFGVADARGFLDENYQGGRPQAIMKDCRSIVVLGVAMLQGSIEALPKGRAEYTNSMLAATVTLRLISFRLSRELEKAGYRATIVPAEGSEFGYWYADKQTLKADVSIRYAAYLAGLGSYGLSHNLITDEYGPRVRFMAIITDAPPADGAVKVRDLVSGKCKNCHRCVAICPAGALTSEGIIHRERCKEYMFTELGGLRCGMCLKVCPRKHKILKNGAL